MRLRVRARLRVRVRSEGRGTSDLATPSWPHPGPDLRAGLRRLLGPWVWGLQGPRERQWPQGSMLFPTTPRAGDCTRCKRGLLAERLSPAGSRRPPCPGGIGWQASGVRVRNTPPRVRVWSWEQGRPEVPVPREAPRRAELRALVGRSVGLRDFGVGVLRRCVGRKGGHVGVGRQEGSPRGQRARFPRGGAPRVRRCESGVPQVQGCRARPLGTEVRGSSLGLGLGRRGPAGPSCPR